MHIFDTQMTFSHTQFYPLRPDKLIDKHAEKDNVLYENAVRGAELRRGYAHAESHARLRQERYAKVFGHYGIAFRGGAARVGAKIFSERTGDYIGRAYQKHRDVEYDAELKLRAAQHEEQSEQRRCPFVRAFHKIVRQRADIAEHRAEHHADQQGGEGDLHAADVERYHRERDGQHDEGDGQGETVGVGEEGPLKKGEPSENAWM